MKTPVAHAPEDRLLDFAYDELPRAEAHAVEQHLQDCARCAETLRGIRGVRRAMARLPLEAEPSAGLDSLLAYAQQSARRAAAGAEPAPRWWRRLMAPALGMAAVSLFGVVVLQVNREVDLSSALQRSSTSDKQAAVQSTSAPAPAAAAAPAALEPEPVAPAYPSADAYPSASAQAPAPAPKAKEFADWGNAVPGTGGGRAEKKGAARSLAASKSGHVLSGLPHEMPVVQAAPAAPMRAREEQRKQERPAESEAAPEGMSVRDSEPFSAEKPMDRAKADDAELTEAPPPPPAAVARSAARASPSPAELLRQADLALRAGDRGQEVVFLRAALSAGARGPEALGALSRLCDAETLLGRLRSALDVCKRVVATAPGSSEARAAQRLLEGPLRSVPAEAN